MSENRWQRIEDIFQQAVALAPEARSAFLDKICAGDESIRKEVESLLAHDAEDGRTFAGEGETVTMIQDLSGRTIGPYHVLGRIGAGGMGVVYKARDTELDRTVAIKVLPSDRLGDVDRRRRFILEAKSASALNHPNIITIHAITREGGAECIVMEYVSGRTLAEAIPKKGLPLKEALRIAIEIADAMTAAHAAGIVHRDLKPSNVMLTETGRVKVLDFGLAKLAESGEPSQTGTETGHVVGTPAYMSPEQAQGHKVDARTDIFSFGCVLYEMVTGRRAFPGDSTLLTMAAILHEEPAPIEGVAPDLWKLIGRCLRKDPERRAQLMKDLKIALEELKEESDSGKAAIPPTPRRSAAGRSWLWIGAALTFFAAGFGSAWLAVSSQNYPPPSAPVPLTSYPGFEKEAAFAPDGNQVAFVWDGEKQDNEDIYVKLIGSGRPLRVTTDPAADFSPAWSPDGRWLAFLRSVPGGKAAVMLVPPLGGAERKLGEVAVPEWWMAGPFLSWSTDSAWLALLDRNSPVESFSIFLLSVETGEKRRLTSPPAVAFSDSSPTFSPDGRSLTFCRASGLSEVYLLPLTSAFHPAGEPKQLTFGSLWAGSPSWAEQPSWYSPRARGEIVFSSTMGKDGLWRIPVAGSRNPEPLPYGDEASYPAVSPRTHRLIYTRTTTVSNISRINPATGAITPLMRSTRRDFAPVFSPDGKRVAFTSRRSGAQEIWVANGDGSDATQLTSMGAPMTGGQHWSPDGTRIIFDSNQERQFELYVVNAGGGKPRRITDHPSNDLAASYSVDGKWIYFGSNRSGDFQIWKMPASGGTPIQVTRLGGFISCDSRDGKWLYYLRAGGMESSLWRISVEGGEETRVLESVLNRGYDLTAEGIYYLAGPPAGRSAGPECTLAFLHLLSFATGRTKQIACVGKAAVGLTVSPDGRQILYPQVVQDGSDLMLVENFR